jgi:hypothetical protein
MTVNLHRLVPIALCAVDSSKPEDGLTTLGSASPVKQRRALPCLWLRLKSIARNYCPSELLHKVCCCSSWNSIEINESDNNLAQ